VRLERPTISCPPPHPPYWRGGKASTPLFPLPQTFVLTSSISNTSGSMIYDDAE